MYMICHGLAGGRIPIFASSLSLSFLKAFSDLLTDWHVCQSQNLIQEYLAISVSSNT